MQRVLKSNRFELSGFRVIAEKRQSARGNKAEYLGDYRPARPQGSEKDVAANIRLIQRVAPLDSGPE